MKETLMIHRDHEEIIEELSDQQAGMLLKAIVRYAFEDEIPETDDQSVGIAFIMLRKFIDKMNDKYEKKCSVNRENGSKGGRPKKTEENPTKPNGYFENPNEANKTLYEYDKYIITPNGDNNIKGAEPEKPTGFDENRPVSAEKKTLPAYPHLPAELSCQEIEDAWMEFRAMRQRIRKPMTRRAEEMLLKDLLELSGGKTGPAIKIVEQSIKNSYQGLFPLREAEKPKGEWQLFSSKPKKEKDPSRDYESVTRDLFVQDAITAAQVVAM